LCISLIEAIELIHVLWGLAGVREFPNKEINRDK
jgi:hypothetical protein